MTSYGEINGGMHVCFAPSISRARLSSENLEITDDSILQLFQSSRINSEKKILIVFKINKVFRQKLEIENFFMYNFIFHFCRIIIRKSNYNTCRISFLGS